jgi:hypothetical protein
VASNFPTSLDNFTNPSSGNTLDSPSHSLQHSDINDAVEALEAKLGIGASPAGSATSGQVLTASTGGTTTWSTPTAGGLIQIVPSSIAVAGAGSSGSVSTNGQITFGTATSVTINDVFSTTYDNYLILIDQIGTANSDLDWRFRVAGSDNSSAVYCFQFSDFTTVSTYVSNRTTNGTSGRITPLNNALRSRTQLMCYTPFLTRTTSWYSESTKTDGTAPTTAIFSGVFTNTTSFTGFTLLPQSGNVTGSISIYGYRN